VGRDMIKVWPLPVEQPWWEELARLTGEHVQQIADHESARTTKLYNCTSDAISLDEIERILI